MITIGYGRSILTQAWEALSLPSVWCPGTAVTQNSVDAQIGTHDPHMNLGLLFCEQGATANLLTSPFDTLDVLNCLLPQQSLALAQISNAAVCAPLQNAQILATLQAMKHTASTASTVPAFVAGHHATGPLAHVHGRDFPTSTNS